MNCLTLRVFRDTVIFDGGTLDGQLFQKGSSVFINGEESWQSTSTPPPPVLQENGFFESGFWVLHRTVQRGFPTIVCSFFNKRTQLVEQSYVKIFHKEGLYRCGPRFPKKVDYYHNESLHINKNKLDKNKIDKTKQEKNKIEKLAA